MISTLILYGSRARGDNHIDSDVDLLGVVPEGRIAGSSTQRAVNIHLRPFENLIEQAAAGDLFVAHIVFEGRVLHDTMRGFEQIASAFEWRNSYLPERRIATHIIDYLSNLPETSTREDLVKRMVWALRTLVIARAAEERLPIFSASAIARYANIDNLERVLITREEPGMREAVVAMAVSVRTALGLRSMPRRRSRAEYERSLLARGGIAASTVRLVNRSSEVTPDPDYE